jgi:quinol monooxygenase YgiN
MMPAVDLKTCQFCNQIFLNNDFLVTHIMRKHYKEYFRKCAIVEGHHTPQINPRPTKRKTCEFCSNTFVDNDALVSHIMQKHYQEYFKNYPKTIIRK